MDNMKSLANFTENDFDVLCKNTFYSPSPGNIVPKFIDPSTLDMNGRKALEDAKAQAEVFLIYAYTNNVAGFDRLIAIIVNYLHDAYNISSEECEHIYTFILNGFALQDIIKKETDKNSSDHGLSDLEKALAYFKMCGFTREQIIAIVNTLL